MTKRYDVVRVNLGLPSSGSHKQAGERPAIVMHDSMNSLPTLVVIPLTSQQAATRFPFVVPINQSKTNGLSMTSYALLFQIQVIDKKLVVSTLGQLEQPDINLLVSELKFMMNI